MHFLVRTMRKPNENLMITQTRDAGLGSPAKQLGWAKWPRKAMALRRSSAFANGYEEALERLFSHYNFLDRRKPGNSFANKL